MALMHNSEDKSRAVFICFTIVLAVAVLVSLMVGQYSMSVKQILQVITGHGEPIDKSVFTKLRVPRTLMAVLAGAGLGLAGAVYQMVFKNPLASPDVIGISSGANLGAAVMIVLFGGSVYQIATGAFFGGVLAVVCVLCLVKATKSNSTSTYVLSGIIISSVASSMIMLLKYYADSDGELAAIEYWTMGSLSAVTSAKVLSILPLWMTGFVLTLLLSRQIEMLNLNEEEAMSLGTRVKQVRVLVLGASTLLVSSVVCITGLISFAGLISPHIVSLLIKHRSKKTLALSAVVGADVLLISDILCRTISTSELPISILTTIIGVPILVFVMIERKSRRI